MPHLVSTWLLPPAKWAGPRASLGSRTWIIRLMAHETVTLSCFDHESMETLLTALAPAGVRYTRRDFWRIWQPDFTITSPAGFMPTLRARLDAALALDDIERRAW